MLATTLGQLLVNSKLPPDLVDHQRVLDRKGTAALFDEIARKHPDQYARIAKDLATVGHKTATSTGGYSFGLNSLRTSPTAKIMTAALEKKIAAIHADPSLSRKDKDAHTLEAIGDLQQKLPGLVYDEARAAGNPLAEQVASGARGKPVNLSSLIGSDLLYVDHRDRALPMPVLRNYSQGMRPHEYYAGSFGTRKGLMDLKLSTSAAGFLSKQTNQVAHRLLVSADDDPEHDPSVIRGLPVKTEDPSNAGALLAHPVAGYPRNTVITPRLLKELTAAGHDEILVRSPTVGGPADGGVYAKDAGIREKRRLPPIGDFVGPAAAQSLSEPITQSMISSKHSGGVAGASAGAIGGFKAIDAMIQGQKTAPGFATHAQLDGTVEGVRPAPQGGWHVAVGGEDHYVHPDSQVTAKIGDKVEAGDPLSLGNPHPGELVRHKHIGEGRRRFVQDFGNILKASNVDADRRNVELLARGLINHVRLTDEVGGWVHGDVLPYQTLERQWQARKGTSVRSPQAAMGSYLEKPVLHYTIGTRVTPSVVSTLKKHGVPSVHAHPEPPPFEPELIRGMANVAEDPDWAVRLLGSFQSRSLLSATHRGATSDSSGSSYVPALMKGTDFGLKGLTKSWES